MRMRFTNDMRIFGMNYRLMFSENKYEIYVDEGSLYDWFYAIL